MGRIQKYALRSYDPIRGSNPPIPDLHFIGVLILGVEGVWNDIETRGTYLDGKIMNRIAIYKTNGLIPFKSGMKDGKYIAEQCRYNPIVILDPRRLSANPIPFFSRAIEFDSLERAIEWIENSSLIDDGNLRKKFTL